MLSILRLFNPSCGLWLHEHVRAKLTQTHKRSELDLDALTRTLSFLVKWANATYCGALICNELLWVSEVSRAIWLWAHVDTLTRLNR